MTDPQEHEETSKCAKRSSSPSCPIRLSESFFDVPCTVLARRLLGQVLVRQRDDGSRLSGRIVETESYLGAEDKASHSYQGKKTPRNSAMYMPPGTAYVYTIYGMYSCFNISSQGEGAAVLIRALEPLEGVEHMELQRAAKKANIQRTIKLEKLCNGPSKLCQALVIDKDRFNGHSLCASSGLWLEAGESIPPQEVIEATRIGIDSAGEEWAKKPLRFYIANCRWVSIRNRQAENIASAIQC